MRKSTRRFNERLYEAKQLLNCIDPALTEELKNAIRVKIVRVAQWNPNEPDRLSQETIKNLVYSLLVKHYLDKDNLCLNNNPNKKPIYWLKRLEYLKSNT